MGSGRNPTLAVLCLVMAHTLVGELSAAEPSTELASFFETSFQQQLERSPVGQAYLGIKRDYHRWDDLSDAAATEELALTTQQLATLRREFDPEKLSTGDRLSYRLFVEQAESKIADFGWRHHIYTINQMFGMHSQVPSFLINLHRIDSIPDAEAYVARLRGVRALMEQVVSTLRAQQQSGVIPPQLVFPMVLSDCRNVLQGQPFDESEDPSTLWQDFHDKLVKLPDVSEAQRDRLMGEAQHALLGYVAPGYRQLIAELERQAPLSDANHGVWSLPRGEAYYRHRLQRMTTTNLTPQEIHQIGLDEIERIHGEMEAICEQVQFAGSLAEFFVFMRNDPQFYFPNTEAGRETYLREAMQAVDRMRASLDHMFRMRPRADMIVKRVEPYREKSTGTAFYMVGSPDGSRAGIYYANLSDMRQMPKYQMEALAYHEGIPGHHMQLSIAQELAGIPKFRRFHRGYSAYVEGWGLYCEFLPKEFGFYQDPYADFGRLAMELWRAARLVVDTGLHHKRWTRQQAIDYLIENTPNAESECERAINRYLVMPGQATAYKVGMLKLLELRSMAMQELGEHFDIRAFHDCVLASGPLPLSILEAQVHAWIDQRRP